jgi:hypothetical protein
LSKSCRTWTLPIPIAHRALSPLSPPGLNDASPIPPFPQITDTCCTDNEYHPASPPPPCQCWLTDRERSTRRSLCFRSRRRGWWMVVGNRQTLSVVVSWVECESCRMNDECFASWMVESRDRFVGETSMGAVELISSSFDRGSRIDRSPSASCTLLMGHPGQSNPIQFTSRSYLPLPPPPSRPLSSLMVPHHHPHSRSLLAISLPTLVASLLSLGIAALAVFGARPRKLGHLPTFLRRTSVVTRRNEAGSWTALQIVEGSIPSWDGRSSA